MLTNEDNEAGNEEANPDAGDYWNILGSVQHLYLEAPGQIKIKVRKKGPPKIKFPWIRVDKVIGMIGLKNIQFMPIYQCGFSR